MKQTTIANLKRLKRKYLHYFLAGFVDGEGSFNVSFARHPTARARFLITLRFQVYQHKDNEEILYLFYDVFRCGQVITKWGTDVRVFTVEGRQNLKEKVIPFFKKYPLATKAEAFEKFEKVLMMMEGGIHKQPQGFREIVELAYAMNIHGKARKIPKEELIKTVENNLMQTRRILRDQTPNTTAFNGE